jgi:hypothetical protein
MPSAELPRYKCHKEVWALKIKDIIRFPEDDKEGNPGGAQLFPEETPYAPFPVDHEYMEKHKPQIGGYYVVYKVGYKSFSPADAFEDGYCTQ